MFKSPEKTSSTPIVYTIKTKNRKQIKERNVIALVSGNKIKMQKETLIEGEVSNIIFEKSKEWFGKEFTYEKIKACLKLECVVQENTRCLSTIYNKDVDSDELYKYLGSKISFIATIDKLEIKGKQITLYCNIDCIKLYKKERLDSKCMIEDGDSTSDDVGGGDDSSIDEGESEISDDEVDIEFHDGDFFE